MADPTHTDVPPTQLDFRVLFEAAPGLYLMLTSDLKIAADGLAMLLRLQGHEVRVAHDGPAALELVKGYRPEMVFLDIGMPQMDGYEVARRLRRQPGLENVRLVALTGWGQQEDRRRTAEAGFRRGRIRPPSRQTTGAENSGRDSGRLETAKQVPGRVAGLGSSRGQGRDP
jgi:CheY-like chemotaxis protein